MDTLSFNRASAEAAGVAARRRVLGALCAAGLTAMLPLRTRAAAASTLVALAAGGSDLGLYKAATRALARSRDGGRSWHELALPIRAGARIDAVTLSPAAASVVYVAGKDLGVLRSTDAGGRWTSVARGLPRNVTAVAAHARQADTVYAYAPGRGIYRSDDAGAHWRLMDAGPRGGITQFAHSDMPGSMQTGWLFAAGPQGVRLSMDCFCGWRPTPLVGSPAEAIAFDPAHPAHIAVIAGGRLRESSDGGQAWSEIVASGPRLTAVAFAPDGTLYAAGGEHVYRKEAHGWEALDA